jgi:uncharacterized glyoxalase superfamily protein PhnB
MNGVAGDKGISLDNARRRNRSGVLTVNLSIIRPLSTLSHSRAVGSSSENSQSSGSSAVGLHLYVNDVDAVFAQAVGEGARIIKPLEDQFYGDRSGALQDPFGHIWFIATHKEDLSLEQIRQRAKVKFKQ